MLLSNMEGIAVMITKLDEIIWDESSMMALLGCSKKALRRLTLEAGLPAVMLERGLYVYLAEEVIKWVVDRKSRGARAASKAENSLSTP
jgi:hypothetical protein